MQNYNHLKQWLQVAQLTQNINNFRENKYFKGDNSETTFAIYIACVNDIIQLCSMHNNLKSVCFKQFKYLITTLIMYHNITPEININNVADEPIIL